MPASLTVLVRRVIRAPVERVFAAWTQPEHLRAWWGPGPVTCPEAIVDLRVGGAYAIANLMPDGRTSWIRGTFEVIDAPTKLVYSWGMDDTPARETVTVRFEERPGGTEVIVSHERIESEEARVSHGIGWKLCLDGLDGFLQ